MWSFVLWSFCALAGSPTGPGVPVRPGVVNEFEPGYHGGVDVGATLSLGSNGRALAPGPTTRVWADFSDANLYRIGVSYAWSGHALGDPSALTADETDALTATDGYVSIHSLGVSSRTMVRAVEGRSSVRVVDPWVLSGASYNVGFGQVQWSEVTPVVASRNAWISLDFGAGVDFRPVPAFGLGVGGFLGIAPAFRSNAGQIRLETLWSFTPALTLSGHL